MQNPYLPAQAQAITQQATQNLQTNILPGINSGAMMAGGFGGSRQGIAQGLAIGQTNQGITNSLAGLYGNAYAQDQQLQAQRDMQQAQLASNQSIAGMQNQTQRDLGFGGLTNQRYGMDQNFGLGMAGLANQRYGMDQSYDISRGNLGLGLYNAETNRGLGYTQLQQQGDQNAFNNQLAGYNAQLSGLNALQNWNNLGLGWANQQQQTPLQNLSQLSNIGASIGGQGGTTSQPGASTVGSALGGALTAAQLWQLLMGGN